MIRTSFFGYEFPYEKAFIDQWSSKDYVDIIAPMVLKEIINNNKGITHIGSDRKTLYEIAKTRNPNVVPMSHRESGFAIPKDTSFYE